MKLTLPKIGPGALVAAAFIGPGTVTACTLAGANFGYALVWALLFATIATIILQDMSARLGAGAKLGLGEALMQNAKSPALKIASAILVFAALAIGNAAYEAGNLAGGALGIEAIFGEASPDRRIFILALAALAAGLLLHGKYKLLERILVMLVLIMSAAFLIAAIMVRPDFRALFNGLIPSIPEGGLLTAIALIGTTIVPYNLFLHAAAARERWHGENDVQSARTDTLVSIGLGGLVSILILTTAAATMFGSDLVVSNAADLARSIEPAFGEAAKYLVGTGLLAAGLTSSITAPMATAYVVTEIWPQNDESKRKTIFRATSLIVLATGVIFSVSGIKPISLILIAQTANGLLLPIIATFLLMVMNRKALLGQYANSLSSNIAGAIVLLVTLGLGLRGIARAFSIWP
ncbi:Nramp family divalent metal transporter [Hirschia baltica]|uniref:Natural resistance-associated macrophage protein n=1 Tax=Hirschia baltica (strain ATCC 49814 / DSM 5838 / IFAM 1418) TaxID=582402 RepID=C6XL47_HIRBI|nr:Nramp family divalent metal transporter [Hirschia baltica]ACT57876.1 natural resistance-associated macrophage protein [Hirschia baltica ATCC 49814]